MIFSVALVIFLARFLPWLVRQPIPGYNSKDKYTTLVKEVEGYDYGKGRDSKLESRLDNATASINSDPVQYYYNLKAKAIYYYKVKIYQASLTILGVAVNFATHPKETGAVYRLYIDNYTALGQPEQAKIYEDLYNALPL